MDDKPNKDEKDSYTLLLEKLDALEKKLDKQDAKIKDVTEFNRSLLSTRSVSSNAPTEEESAKAKLDKFLKE